MTDSEIAGYLQLIEIIMSGGIQTFDVLKVLLSANVSPTDLEKILAQTQVRLERRGIKT
jgi:hypothetical protein